jgi:hypothetical protein
MGQLLLKMEGQVEMGVSKSGPGAGQAGSHGGPINKNLPLFLCLLIKN